MIPFAAGATSLLGLSLYFFGVLSMRATAAWVVLPGVLVSVAFVVITDHVGRRSIAHRVMAGLFAGGLATLFFDVVRVPVVHAGVPVFKNIAYYGTLLAATSEPTAQSDLFGWAYHYWKGVGYAVAYAALIAHPRLWSALAWGALLAVWTLATPFAEIFGFARDPQFLATTIVSCLVYGFFLWLGLRAWPALWEGGHTTVLIAGLVGPLIGIALVALDFHLTCADGLDDPPPARITAPGGLTSRPFDVPGATGTAPDGEASA